MSVIVQCTDADLPPRAAPASPAGGWERGTGDSRVCRKVHSAALPTVQLDKARTRTHAQDHTAATVLLAGTTFHPPFGAMPSKQGARLFWRLSSTQHPKSDLQQTISGHLLNHALQVLLPVTGGGGDAAELELELQTLFPPDDGPEVVQGSIGSIAGHVVACGLLSQPGASVQALSLAERLDSGAGAAITPDGVLHLAVDSELYQRLGLVGRHATGSTGRAALPWASATAVGPGAGVPALGPGAGASCVLGRPNPCAVPGPDDEPPSCLALGAGQGDTTSCWTCVRKRSSREARAMQRCVWGGRGGGMRWRPGIAQAQAWAIIRSHATSLLPFCAAAGQVTHAARFHQRRCRSSPS